MVFSNSPFPSSCTIFQPLTELQKGQITYLKGKPWVSSTASTESNPFLSSSPTTRQHTIAFIDQKALMKSALAVVWASISLCTVLVYVSMSLWKSVTFYQQLTGYVAESRPWVPLCACLVSCLCFVLFAHSSLTAVFPSALGAGVHAPGQGLNCNLCSQSSLQLPFLYSQEEGKVPVILHCSCMRSWFGKCSETLEKINSTICFDLRVYRCLF